MTKDRKINIEMQAAKQDDFEDKTLFYLAELHINGTEKETEYGDISQIIAVNILGDSKKACCLLNQQ